MNKAQAGSTRRYRHDALDRLCASTEPGSAGEQLFYLKSRVSTEIHADGGRSIVQYNDLLLAHKQQQDDVEQTALLACDSQRSVLGAAAQPSLRYSPYGVQSGPSPAGSLLGFNGERRDPFTGHYLLGNGYRAFNPVIRRFNAPDSQSPFGNGGVNAYAYCAGDPINRCDPSGHFFTALMQRLASAIDHWAGVADSGVRLQKISNVQRLGKNMYKFDDMTKAGRRLNIDAHGAVLANRGVFAADGKTRLLSASDLVDLIDSAGIDRKRYVSARLLICNSADEVNKSVFAQNFANISNLTTKGFHGDVAAKGMPPHLDNLQFGHVAEGPFDFHYFNRTRTPSSPDDGIAVNYRPQVFNPQQNTIRRL